MSSLFKVRATRAIPALMALVAACSDGGPRQSLAPPEPDIALTPADVDAKLYRVLNEVGMTGRVGQSLTTRLGRPLDPRLVTIGQLLFFDAENGLHGDNSCAGCHNPKNGFGDSQSIAIGIDNNGVVGPGRTGPRNQRRTPILTNIAFAPALMWNSRFFSNDNDPFSNKTGFTFPAPEGPTLGHLPHLLTAQAFIPPTERVEMAGFAFPGNNDDIRAEVIKRLNKLVGYRERFAAVYPHIKAGAPISYAEFGHAVAEFTFSLDFMDAPIDRFARGQPSGMTASEKAGALLFFGKAKCVGCHQASGTSNEMFSDFKQHVIGVPQIIPANSNVTFDGPGANEDFGLAQITGLDKDRYAFRTSPLRNISLQTTFMHNGAYTRLEDAIRHHLNAYYAATTYSPALAGVAPDLRGPVGPIQPVLNLLDPRMRNPIVLTDAEFKDLVQFVRTGLLDPRTSNLTSLIPKKLPSGRPLHVFQ